jgi:hypothetical protein
MCTDFPPFLEPKRGKERNRATIYCIAWKEVRSVAEPRFFSVALSKAWKERLCTMILFRLKQALQALLSLFASSPPVSTLTHQDGLWSSTAATL